MIKKDNFAKEKIKSIDIVKRKTYLVYALL